MRPCVARSLSLAQFLTFKIRRWNGEDGILWREVASAFKHMLVNNQV